MTFNMPEKLKNIVKKLMSKDKLLLVLLFGVLLIVINIPAKKSQSSDNSSNETKNAYTEAAENIEDYAKRLEKELEDSLSASSDIGKTNVVINVKNTGKKILYIQKNVSSSSIKETDSSGGSRLTEESELEESVVYSKVNGDEQPYIISEEMPEIQGVIICSQGADTPSVVSKITEAASAFLNIPVNKIKVLKLEV